MEDKIKVVSALK